MPKRSISGTNAKSTPGNAYLPPISFDDPSFIFAKIPQGASHRHMEQMVEGFCDLFRAGSFHKSK